MGESEEGIPTGLSLTLSIPLFLMSLLCLYISVSLYLTISPYLCVSPSVNISLILPSVYSLYLNSLLNNTHTYIYCNTHTHHLRFRGTNINSKSLFWLTLLNMALKCKFYQSQLNQGKLASIPFRYVQLGTFAPALQIPSYQAQIIALCLICRNVKAMGLKMAIQYQASLEVIFF